MVGEAGVGKSRLLYEFGHSHHTQGWLVLESASVSYGKATPYFPVIDLLKRYCHVEERDDHRTIRAKVTGQLLTLDETLHETLPALLARRQGELPRAIPALERSLALCQSANFPRLFPVVAAILGMAYALAGRAPEAVALLDQALQHLATGSRVIFHAQVLTELSEALLLVGRVEEAGGLAGRLLTLSRTHPGRGYQAHASRLLGEVAMRRESPDLDQATAHYRQGLALAEEVGMRPLQAHCHLGLGTFYARTGQRQQAHAELSAAIDLYRAMDMTFWLPQAEVALAQVEKRAG
jgi:tetratricopeptide (TPR) repeat protein